MYSSLPISSSLHAHLWQSYSDRPVLYFSPKVLHESYQRFLLGFDGLVTYAVKANASSLVLDNLASAGLTTFDVASPAEMQTVRAVLPSAVLHYHNPVRSLVEIAEAKRFGVQSWAVDSQTELDKLGALQTEPKSQCDCIFRLQALPMILAKNSALVQKRWSRFCAVSNSAV